VLEASQKVGSFSIMHTDHNRATIAKIKQMTAKTGEPWAV
jgi:hypothetical protein